MQAMQLSNGLADPVGLWLGHLMFDSIFAIISASIIIIIFAAVSNQFHGLGLFVGSFHLPFIPHNTNHHLVGRFGVLRHDVGTVVVLRFAPRELAAGSVRGVRGIPSGHVCCE